MTDAFTSSMAASGIGASWMPVDLSSALLNGGDGPVPELLKREDDACLLYLGKTHTIAGESESLKTWLALIAVVEALNAGQHVLFLDYEDSAVGIVGRLIALGCQPLIILDHFSYVSPAEPYGPAARSILMDALTRPPLLTVIDGITEAMASNGLDPLSNADAAKFRALLPDPLAALGAAVAMIDHVPKSREANKRYAIGAQHKLAAVTGASYIVELVKPFGHGLHGMSKIIISKDRIGRIREHSPGNVAGMLRLESQLDGSVLARIEPPERERRAEDSSIFRPTVLMERISETVAQNPGLSGRAVVEMTRGKLTQKRTALELLLAEGFVTAKRDGNSYRHFSARPYRQEENRR